MNEKNAPDWLANAPAMLRGNQGPDGEECSTPLDRRWLWRLEGFLAICGTNDAHRVMQRDLAQYLGETCEHHWRNWEADEMLPHSHRQCLWCNVVELTKTTAETGGDHA